MPDQDDASHAPGPGLPTAEAVALLSKRLAAAEAALEAGRAEQTRLTYELGHRVKNTLSVVQALAGQTMRGAATKEEALATFGTRVLALARANDAILHESWTTAGLQTVARAVLEPAAHPGLALTLEGPDLRLPAGAALSLGMALQELASNARRFGAWSVPGGHVALTWTSDGEAVSLGWVETGGPVPTPPDRRGFGLRLVEQSLQSAFGRDVTLAFPPEGLICRVRAPAARFAA